MYVYIGPYPEKYNDERQVDVRVDNYDVWNADHTLALVILPVLRKLKENKHGCPHTDVEDAPIEETDVTEADDEQEFHWNNKRWCWIMDEMIWAFEQLAGDGDGEDQFHSGEIDILWQAHDKDNNKIGEPSNLEDTPEDDDAVGITHYTLVDGPNHTRQTDTEGLKKYRERIVNGTRLFGKYYQALWD
jgi:hypothetical protein